MSVYTLINKKNLKKIRSDVMGVSRLSSNSQKTPLPPTKHPPNCGPNLRFWGPNALSTAPLEKDKHFSDFSQNDRKNSWT